MRLAVCFLMKLDGIVRGVLDDDYGIKIPFIVYHLTSSINPETGATTL